MSIQVTVLGDGHGELTVNSEPSLGLIDLISLQEKSNSIVMVFGKHCEAQHDFKTMTIISYNTEKNGAKHGEYTYPYNERNWTNWVQAIGNQPTQFRLSGGTPHFQRQPV